MTKHEFETTVLGMKTVFVVVGDESRTDYATRSAAKAAHPGKRVVSCEKVRGS